MTTADRLIQVACDARSGATDGDLLRQYAEDRDEDAFAEIVRRNGPLVLRACRSVLGEAGAEDAFQATFLILARKASALARPGSLVGWLLAVAVRTAHAARRTEARARRREAARAAPPEAAADDLTWREVREVLDAELAALPEKYRIPLVLCYFQELSYEEAARRAGCPVGALRGRLERGKERLRKRLANRGLPLAATVLVLGRPSALSAALTTTTLDTVRTWAAGGAVPRTVAALLATGVRLKAGLVASAIVLGSLVALAGAARTPTEPPEPGQAPQPQSAQPAPPPRTDPRGDLLPPGAVMRLGTRRFQVETWPVEPVPLTGGAHYLIHHTDAGWSRRTELRWMDAASGVTTAVWPIPTGHHMAAVSADGRWVVVAKTKFFNTGLRTEPDPKTAPIEFALYDLPARKVVAALACQSDEAEGPMAQVHRAIMSADGKWVATVNSGDSGTGRVRLWQIATGKPVWASTLSDLNGPKYTLVGFTPGSAELVLRAAKDNRIDVVDTAKGVVVRSFPTMAEQVEGQALAPDGSAVILGTYAAKVRVWDLKTGKERAPLEGHKEWARRFAFTPDGKTLVTGGNDPYLLVRDWPSGVIRKRVELGRGAVQSLFVSGDGKYADVLFWWESALARYDLTTGKPFPRPADTHRAPVVAVTAAPDGSVLSVGVDKVLRVWDPATGRQLRTSPLDPGDGTRPRTLTPNGGVFDPCVVSPDGRFRAQPGPAVGKVSVENVKTRATVTTLDARSAGWWTQTAVPAFSPDGRILAVADGDSVRFWTVNGWGAAGSVPATTSALDFSPDGRSLATADLNDVTVWEVATRQVRATIRAGSQVPVRPRFSPDGRYLAWVVRSEAVEVWDVRRGRMAATFRGHEGRLRDFAFTSDGRSLVTASDDGTLLVWDVAGAASVVAVPSEQQLREAWDDLGSSDPVRAFTGIRVLASAPDQMVPLVRAGVKPVAPVDAAAVDRLLADLTSETFATREAATAGLIAAGDAAEGKVRAYLAATPDPEGRLRAGQILVTISGPPTTAVRRRELRAVEALEWAGTAGAEELLRGLAKGAPEARLTRDAAAALRRLGSRP